MATFLAAWQALINLFKDGLQLFYGLTGNYGLAIIAFTLLVRFIMLPLTWSQTTAMKKMQELQPQTERLQKKYKNDKQKLNEEMVKLWRENNVNPAGGCLPLLLQMPIIIAFFQALRGFAFVGDAGFLWIPNLAEPDPSYILPILAGLTTYLQSRLATPGGGSGEGMQRSMLYFMPIFIGWISIRFPAGLSLYWVMSNIFSIGQQYAIPAGRAQEAGKRGKGEAS